MTTTKKINRIIFILHLESFNMHSFHRDFFLFSPNQPTNRNGRNKFQLLRQRGITKSLNEFKYILLFILWKLNAKFTHFWLYPFFFALSHSFYPCTQRYSKQWVNGYIGHIKITIGTVWLYPIWPTKTKRLHNLSHHIHKKCVCVCEWPI